MNPPRHRQLLRAVTQTPWAIRPEKLAAILELVSLRLEGHKLSDEEIRERIGAARPSRSAPGADKQPAGGVAVIPIYGAIVPKANLMSDISGGTSLEMVSAELQDALANPQVATILLDVDSPGGSTDLVTETAALIRKARTKKQVIAVANPDAASAAFWLASQASELVVTPSGMVGSIGVFAAHQDISAAQEKAGVKTTLISAGAHKTEGSPFEPLTEEARATIQDFVDQAYHSFLADVAVGRGVDVQTVQDSYGQGRMLTARDALKAGMVDRIATFDDTLTRLVGPGATRKARTQRAETHVTLVAAEASAPALAAGATTNLQAAESAVTDAFVVVGEISEPDETQDFTEDQATAATAPPSSAPSEQSSRATAGSTHTRKENTGMRSIEELVARQDEISARQKEIDAEFPGEKMSEEASDEFKKLDAEWATLEAAIKDIRERKASLALKVTEAKEDGFERGDKPTVPYTNAGRRVENVWSIEDYRKHANSVDELAGLYTDGAKRALELVDFAHPRAKRESVQGHIERLLAGDAEKGDIARRLLATSSPQYDRAFGKMVLGKPLTGPENQALSLYGLSLAGADGGYAVPLTLDPTVIPTSNGAVNPWRQLASIKTITGNTWKGVASDGVTVAYQDEATEVADGGPTLVQPEINVEKAQAFIRFSIEIGEDWAGMRGELATMLADAKDVKEADKFALGVGHGSHEPEGVIAGRDTGTDVTTATIHVFAIDDLLSLDDALPPRYEPNGAIVANKAFYNAIRSLTGDQFDVWMQLADGPARNDTGQMRRSLLGYPSWRCSAMSSALTTGNALVAVLGDFAHSFAIVDRVGMSLEVIPHLMGVSGRPTGERGLYTYFRNSSAVLDTNGIRVLKIKAS